MSIRTRSVMTLAVILSCWIATFGSLRGQAQAQPKNSASTAGLPQRVQAYLSRMPLRFEANRGQTDSRVQYMSRGQGYTLFLTSSEAVLALAAPHGEALHPAATVIRLQLAGANPDPVVTHGDELATRSDYFIGNDPGGWHTNIPNYGRVSYSGVYPGIDLVYYGRAYQLEHDFVVAPGADPSSIALAVTGSKKIAQDAEGNVVLTVEGGEVRLEKPTAYQEIAGVRRNVPIRYRFAGSNRIGFEPGTYDRRKRLVIDPVLSYSTYLGGSAGSEIRAIAVDLAGNAYVTGSTTSSDFPVVNSLPSPNNALQGGSDAFVARLLPAGDSLVYSTYLGGSQGAEGRGIAVDASGNAYVTGSTSSSDFPVVNPLPAPNNAYQGGSDAFVAKLSAAGNSLVYSTYLGGSGNDSGNGVAVDSSGNAYVTGNTTSADLAVVQALPSPNNALQGSQDAFVARLAPSGSSLVYATYLGGSNYEQGTGVAVDSSGNAYVTGMTTSSDFPVANPLPAPNNALQGGSDAFVAKLAAQGGSLIYSTYLGGSGGENGGGIAVDSLGNATIAGGTTSPDFPMFHPLPAPNNALEGGSDAFVAKVGPGGNALVYSTYLGGSGADGGTGVALDPAGNAYVAGYTSSADFPSLNPLAAPNNVARGGQDVFTSQLSLNGSSLALAYSARLGGSGDDSVGGIAVDAAGNAYVAGVTASADFPTTAGALQTTALSLSSCVSFPSGFVPFAQITQTLPGPSSTLVVGIADANWLQMIGNIPLPSFSGQAFCGPVQLAPGIWDNTYLPTAAERTGDFSAFPGQMMNPLTTPPTPIPNNIIPANTLGPGGVWAMEIGAADNQDSFVARIAGDNTPTGSDVTVTPNFSANGTSPVKLTFSSVTQTGNSMLVISSTGPAPANGFRLGTPATYYNVTTSAAYSGTVQICIDSTGVAFDHPEAVAIWHYDVKAGAWTELPTTAGSAANTVCAPTPSLSPFALFEAVAEPVLSVTPQTLSFSATAGGSNPAPQTISISNTGSGTLNWTAAATQSWLSLDSSSGTAPSTLQAAVNLGDMAAGIYHDTITLEATGATGSPQSVNVTLTVGLPPDFEIDTPSGGSNSATVTAGSTASYGLEVTPLNGFTGAVSFACSGLPSKSTCTVSPASAAITGSASVPFAVAVATTAATTSAAGLTIGLGGSPWAVVAWALFLLASVGLLVRRRQMWRQLFLLALLACGLGVVSCGGGKHVDSNPTTTPGTSAGTYTVVLTSTAGAISHTTNLTLTVQ